jgi:hypothetical protein
MPLAAHRLLLAARSLHVVARSGLLLDFCCLPLTCVLCCCNLVCSCVCVCISIPRHSTWLPSACLNNPSGPRPNPGRFVYSHLSCLFQDSFDHVQEWLVEVNRYANEGTCKLLIGNKSDCTDKMVAEAEGQAFADRLSIPFLETSAKTADNVEEAFTRMASQLIKLRCGRASVWLFALCLCVSVCLVRECVNYLFRVASACTLNLRVHGLRAYMFTRECVSGCCVSIYL